MAKKQEYELIERNTVKLTITVLNSSGGAYDLTGKTLEFKAKWNNSDIDSQAVISLETGSGITTLNPPTNGVIEVQFSAIDLTYPFHLPYRLDVMSGAERETVQYGTLKVVNR